jgi:hypothetical protein
VAQGVGPEFKPQYHKKKKKKKKIGQGKQSRESVGIEGEVHKDKYQLLLDWLGLIVWKLHMKAGCGNTWGSTAWGLSFGFNIGPGM